MTSICHLQGMQISLSEYGVLWSAQGHSVGLAGLTTSGHRCYSQQPHTTYLFGLEVKGVLQSHPVAPVSDPQVPWTG